jgi:hypothetical protein
MPTLNLPCFTREVVPFWLDILLLVLRFPWEKRECTNEWPDAGCIAMKEETMLQTPRMTLYGRTQKLQWPFSTMKRGAAVCLAVASRRVASRGQATPRARGQRENKTKARGQVDGLLSRTTQFETMHTPLFLLFRCCQIKMACVFVHSLLSANKCFMQYFFTLNPN